jgi:hypothetical protein
MYPGLARAAATLATGLSLLGAALVVKAVAATRGLWYDGYVSEAGVGQQASTYRAGVLGIGAGLLLLAVSVAGFVPMAAVLLAIGGVFAVLSGSVACSKGCPLPPYESPTAADLVHAGASVLAIGLVGLAMIAVALGRGAEAALRRASRLAVFVVVPVLAAAGFAVLGLGRGPVTGVLERTSLALTTTWMLVLCIGLSRPARSRRS